MECRLYKIWDISQYILVVYTILSLNYVQSFPCSLLGQGQNNSRDLEAKQIETQLSILNFLPALVVDVRVVVEVVGEVVDMVESEVVVVFKDVVVLHGVVVVGTDLLVVVDGATLLMSQISQGSRHSLAIFLPASVHMSVLPNMVHFVWSGFAGSISQ